MKDQYFEAYESALQSLPEKQRAALVKLVTSHGLRPDDPTLVGPVFTHMLLGRVDAVLNAFESATDPKRFNYSLWVLRTLASVLNKSKSLGPILAIIAILSSIGVGYTVYRTDHWQEHSRVCAAEIKYIGHLIKNARQSGRAATSHWIEQQNNDDCGS